MHAQIHAFSRILTAQLPTLRTTTYSIAFGRSKVRSMRVRITGSVTECGRPDRTRYMVEYIDVDDGADKTEIWLACCKGILTTEEQECIDTQRVKLVVDSELSVDFSDLSENYIFKPRDATLDVEYTATLFPKPRSAYAQEGMGLLVLAMFIAVLTTSLYQDSETCYDYDFPFGKLGAGIVTVLYIAGMRLVIKYA